MDDGVTYTLLPGTNYTGILDFSHYYLDSGLFIFTLHVLKLVILYACFIRILEANISFSSTFSHFIIANMIYKIFRKMQNIGRVCKWITPKHQVEVMHTP